jgi:Asp/Glu/hydantoin racemase
MESTRPLAGAMSHAERGGGTGTLGILQLENRPMTVPGAMGHPGTFAYPVRRGAWVDGVVRGDPDLAGAYVEAARALEQGGVAAITTNCGFSVLYQAALREAVAVPVASSSLLLCPLVSSLAPGHGKIGVLTYDARHLGERHLRAAGFTGEVSSVVVAGIEGTASWAELGKPEPAVDATRLAADVREAAARLLITHPEVGALLLECAAFTPFAAQIRADAGRPVFDLVTLADALMASVARGPRPGAPGR